MRKEVEALLQYGLQKELLKPEDVVYCRNRLYAALQLQGEPLKEGKTMPLSLILEQLLAYAVAQGLIEDTQNSRDQFDSMLMDILMPRPSEMIHTFQMKYRISPQSATSYYYELSRSSNYIRTDRIEKDVKWVSKTKYGLMDITINMSKPEKDPKDIAKARLMTSQSYPKCALCRENEGFIGSATQAARSNHRLIPLTLGKDVYYLQYSPYSYYQEHCILLNERHIPMSIDKHTFFHLLDFVRQFPHYFAGSNADLPIVGGSILSHDHYQGGNDHFAMEDAPLLDHYSAKQFSDVSFGRLFWPLSILRAQSQNIDHLVAFADHILQIWKDYEDEALGILPYSEGERHNTITPIARYRNGMYELDLVLRNNRISAEKPMGIFHPSVQWHHIKKENIGLIEVMGLAVLPSRLKKELDEIELCLQKHEELPKHLRIHKQWYEQLKQYEKAKTVDWHQIIQDEVGTIFSHVLEDCGVFKQDDQGKQGFLRLITKVNEVPYDK